MTGAAALARSCGFAVLFLVAALLGRQTALEGTSISLVWPATGVAAVWFVVQRRARWPAVDWVLLVGASLAVSLGTGATPARALIALLASVVQIVVFRLVLGRLRPDWQAEPTPGLTRVTDLWRLVLAAVLSTLCGAAIAPAVSAVMVDDWSWLTTLLWMTRNVTSVVLIGGLGFRLFSPRTEEKPEPWTATRLLESGALLACTVVAYVVVFAVTDGLPVTFPLLVATVWAASRWPTTWVLWQGVLVGSAAMVFTLTGHGPFALIESLPLRALIAQLFVAVVAVLGPVMGLGRDERRMMDRQLSGALAAFSAQAGLLTTIVESISDGLVVVEADGRVVLRNPAAITLIPGVQIPSLHAGDNPHVLAFGLDGRQLDQAELPHARALRGEMVSGHDIRVRNVLTAEERILHVRATPLPIEVIGVQQAVVVYHDVTVERRDRDELTAFAGVVAHDLLNPLTTVDGWSETLAEMLQEMPADPAVLGARDSVVRIRRAAGRMRHLINDLLVHATARDAALMLKRVALGDLVTEIVNARIDQATAAEQPLPRFTIGRLDDVHADPVLLRQLLDNLISNAIKYTAPGQEPHLTIRTRQTGDGFVQLSLTDNGIGIPLGQHEAIFGNFHRAHREAGYGGTGLGLAICARIVERHGGRIVASDNPLGPGACFTATLPAPATLTPPSPSIPLSATTAEVG